MPERTRIHRDTEAALVALLPDVKRGEPRASTAFFAALGARFRRMAGWELVRRGLVLDEADLDDVVQQALVDVWQLDLHRFEEGRGALLAFLRRRVRWKVLERVRGRVRQRTRSLEARSDAGHDVEDEGAGPEQRLGAAAREQMLASLPRAVAAAASTLDDEQARVAIVRHDLDGVPLRRVARELGVHPSNATRARQRGLLRLQQSLGARWREAARADSAAACS